MKILAHRGLWSEPREKNSLNSLTQAIEAGFGVETDIRDLNGELVISHDLPELNSDVVRLDDFLSQYIKLKSSETLALNIKSDGLQTLLFKLLSNYGITNYFVFDMSIPDTINYSKGELHYFLRISELEAPIDLKNFSGYWLDSFDGSFDYNKYLGYYISKNKVCIVSPELHGRDFFPLWNMLKKNYCMNDLNDSLLLCTDYPSEAKSFFNL